MKIIRIDRFNGKEETISTEFAKTIFTNPKQLESLLASIPQATCGFIYQLDTENKESDCGQ